MQEVAKKYFKWFLILAIIAIVCGVLISKCTGKVKEVRTEKKEDKQVVQNNARVESLETVATTLQSELQKAHAKAKIDSAASKRLIGYWKNKALTSRAKVDTVINSNPDLKEFIGDQDSLISVIEARNAKLEAEKSRQFGDFNRLLSITEEQLKLQQETTAIIADQRDRYKKKAGKRFSIGPYVGIDYKLQPSLGVSVQYRLLRF
jgi:hypothetical protein